MQYIITIPGRPVSQKNSKEIGRRGRGGKPFIRSNAGVREWHRNALPIVKTAWRRAGIKIPPGVLVGCTIMAYLAKGQTMDCDAIASAPMDALEAAGVVSNDYWLEPLIVCRKWDAGSPRVVVLLEVPE